MSDRQLRWQRYWDGKGESYDREMAFWDRHLFGDSRQWACSRASGEVLEVAVGSGLNLPHYPAGVAVTGIDLAENMLAMARARAATLELGPKLLQGSAHDLPFADASFDTVLCTFGLCAIPDHSVAIDEMVRVLRPGGRLVLVDHVESSSRVARGVQWLVERITIPLGGEHFRRRPLLILRERGLRIEETERFKLGLVERVAARKPA